MSRWRTFLVVAGLVLATPLNSGCLTTLAVRAVTHVVQASHKDKATHGEDGSGDKKQRSQEHPESAPARRESPEQHERSE
jgi:hypothetical protein